jgi:Peptidase M15
MSIDWTDSSANVTDHFTVGDCLTLHSWNRLANESDGLNDDGKDRLVALCQKMEQIRTLLNCPINVHCMFRSQDYNSKIVGAIPDDVHAQFLACDFDASPNKTISEIQSILEPVLEQYGIRMERNTPTWVHIDLHPVVHQRYFTT